MAATLSTDAGRPFPLARLLLIEVAALSIGAALVATVAALGVAERVVEPVATVALLAGWVVAVAWMLGWLLVEVRRGGRTRRQAALVAAVFPVCWPVSFMLWARWRRPGPLLTKPGWAVVIVLGAASVLGTIAIAAAFTLSVIRAGIAS